MQNIGYGIIMPVHCPTDLLISPTASSEPSQLRESVRPRDDPTLSTLLWSIMFSFILPAAMMSLPVFSSKVHHYLIAVWQAFPFWIITLQYIFGKASWFFPSPHHLTSRASGIYATDLERLNQAYRFAFALAILTHCIALGIIALVLWFPAPIAAFDSHTFTYQDVFLPLNLRTRAQISDMVQGAQSSFQYDQYVGLIAAITWAATLRSNLRNKSMSAM
jgi:hypothetical protein